MNGRRSSRVRSLRCGDVCAEPGLGVIMQHGGRWEGLLISTMLLRIPGWLG